MKENQSKDYDNKLLIIDDELEITKALVRQFKKRYTVFSATNAEEGFKILENENIQVIISDQRMPGMTGVEFFTKIKEKHPDTLKLILTGYSDIEAVIGAINDVQVFRYLKKPWNPVELDSIIKEAFEKHELIIQNRILTANLVEANQHLDEKVKERTKDLVRYLNTVSHDLKSPLLNIQGFTERLLKQMNEILTLLTNSEFDIEKKSAIDKLTREIKSKTIHYILSNIIKMDTLLKGLLQISRTGQSSLNLATVDMNQLIKTIFAGFEFETNKLSVTVNIDNLASCYGDEAQLNQVFSNLIGNAIKYRKLDQPLILGISSIVYSDNIVYKVSDNGIGINASQIERIWDVFYRVDPSSSETGEGIGLNIVKTIVSKHNGSIWVESKEGKGSTFFIELPTKNFN